MRKLRTDQWMGIAFGGAVVIVAIVYLGADHSEKLNIGLKATARWSFLWFWPASVGSALATLFGPRFKALAQRGRDFGLAFASAHLVHMGLVALLLHEMATPFARAPLIFFSIAAFWIYLLAILSVGRLSAMLHPTVWWLLRTVGVEYISYAFISDFEESVSRRSAAPHCVPAVHNPGSRRTNLAACCVGETAEPVAKACHIQQRVSRSVQEYLIRRFIFHQPKIARSRRTRPASERTIRRDIVAILH